MTYLFRKFPESLKQFSIPVLKTAQKGSFLLPQIK
jgi:hypothetical protein